MKDSHCSPPEELLKGKRDEKWGKGKGTCDIRYTITFLMRSVFNESWVKAIRPGESSFTSLEFGVVLHGLQN